jgi:hypothetical protein
LQFHNFGWVHRDGQARRKIEAEIGVVLSRLSPRDSILFFPGSQLARRAVQQRKPPAPRTKPTGAVKLRARGVRRDHGVTCFSLLLGPHGHVMFVRPEGLTCSRAPRGANVVGQREPGQTRWTQTGCSSSQRQLSLPWPSFGICCRARLLLRPRQTRRQLQRRRSRNSSHTRSGSSW